MFRVMTLHLPKNNFSLSNIHLEGYSFVFPHFRNDKEKNNYIYIISEKEEFYDEQTNFILEQYFPHMMRHPRLYHLNNSYYKNNTICHKNAEFLDELDSVDPFEFFLYDTKYNKQVLSLPWYKSLTKIKAIYKIKRYNLTINQIYQPESLPKSKYSVPQIEIPAITELHPFYISNRPIGFHFNYTQDVFPEQNFFKNNITNIFKSLQDSYETLLSKIEKKEGVVIENKHFFNCNEIEISQFKYLSSMIAVQDFCYVLGAFTEMFPLKMKRYIRLWYEALFSVDNKDIQPEIFKNYIFDSIDNEEFYNFRINSPEFEVLIDESIREKNDTLLQVILDNKLYIKHHDKINIYFTQQTLMETILENNQPTELNIKKAKNRL